MSILKELLELNPAYLVLEGAPPIEISKIITLYPQAKLKDALDRLWGTTSIAWHGKRFFDHNELGPAYQEAEDAAIEIIEDNYTAECNLDIDGNIDGVDFSETVSWEAEITDQQECYLGYDVKTDKLYIGFDAWTSEDEFNTAFDKAFEGAVGVEYNSDDEEHVEVYNRAFKEYKSENLGFFGLIFEVDSSGRAVDSLPPMAGGFYKGTYRLFKSQHPNVIDLRLD